MDDLNTLASLGFILPSPAYLFGTLLFGVVGYAAYRYGRKAVLPKIKWGGIALMLFPYAISETWLLYVVGIGLCAAQYVNRK